MRKLLVVSIMIISLIFCIAFEVMAEKITVGFTPPSFVSPYWTYILKAAEQEAEKLGVELITVAPKDHTDFEGQISILEDFVQKGVDVIVMGVVDKAAVVPGQKIANKAGIPIVILNQTNPQPGDVEIASYIGGNGVYGGLLLGEWTADNFAEANVVVIEGIPGEGSNERFDGWSVITKYYPNIKVLDSQIADWDEGKALTVMENFLEAYPDIDLVIGLCDSMALGAITAAKGAGRFDEMKFIGYDGTLEAMQSIKKGELTATLIQPALEQGQWGIQTAVKIANGEKVPLKQRIPLSIITQENVDEFLKIYEELGVIK
ncbi:MAG: sugar ABC transporter substrate-binding protein [Candidatus Heimdallarchaeota archaeon]|nr:sugar ABC transporter substrate-binding protein [Candidatus Heimdallarchaeota archaeon]